ncbi:MAG: family 16 glycosylhydrolase [Draconibacterium sp.]|nr:family 16 glycosylhydrolase [Draconibacterium sp.]
METDSVFSYGVYECNATFANQKGSFPAFWSMSKEDCNAGIPNNEIDIVELKYEESNPTIDDGMFFYPIPCGSGNKGYGFKESSFTWGGAHTFKCIWKPSKIEFWVDNTKLNTVLNNGDYRYPQYEQRVILSQQITIYIPNKNNPPIYGIITPQTSNFHWVKVREFFLAPEITCPSVICSNDTAVMDVDPDATNISWSLSPTNLFSGSTSGTGKITPINRASGNSGEGTITYFFEMPSGETFDAEKTFCVGSPAPTISSTWSEACNCYVSDPLETFTTYDWDMITCNTSTNTTDYIWEVWGYELEMFAQQSESTNGTRTTYPYTAYGKHLSYTFYDAQYYTIKAKQKMCGSWSSWANKYITVGDGLLMVIAPNPTGGETTLSIKSSSEKTLIDESTVWEMEIYSPEQVLTQKTTKLRGSSTTIQTSGWKEGVYTVRVKLSIKEKADEILTGKLVVKK